jgi:hypothetical protein
MSLFLNAIVMPAPAGIQRPIPEKTDLEYLPIPLKGMCILRNA